MLGIWLIQNESESPRLVDKINHLRWQLIADRDEWPRPYTIIRRFLFELVGMISLDRNDWEVINLSFVLFYSNVLKTEKILQFWNKKILDVRGDDTAQEVDGT